MDDIGGGYSDILDIIMPKKKKEEKTKEEKVKEILTQGTEEVCNCEEGDACDSCDPWKGC